MQLTDRGSYFHIIWGTPLQKSAASTHIPIGNP